MARQHASSASSCLDELILQAWWLLGIHGRSLCLVGLPSFRWRICSMSGSWSKNVPKLIFYQWCFTSCPWSCPKLSKNASISSISQETMTLLGDTPLLINQIHPGLYTQGQFDGEPSPMGDLGAVLVGFVAGSAWGRLSQALGPKFLKCFGKECCFWLYPNHMVLSKHLRVIMIKEFKCWHTYSFCLTYKDSVFKKRICSMAM